MAQSPNASEKRDVYISYSHMDVTFARLLSVQLQDNGITCWIDLNDLPAAENWQNVLDSRLESSGKFIFIVSRASVTSENCKSELTKAMRLFKQLIPVIHEHVSNEEMPKELAQITWIDFSREGRYYDAALSNLIQVIKGKPVQADPNPAQRGTPPPPPNVEEPPIKISLLAPNSTSAEEFPATPALARLLAKATAISQAYEKDFDLSFSSMLLAFLASDDPLSLWLARYVKDAGIAIDELIQARKLKQETFEQIAERFGLADRPASAQQLNWAWLQQLGAQPLTEEELSTLDRPRVRTDSAEYLVQTARGINADFNSIEGRGTVTPVDVRHLMAVYIYFPSGHAKDLEGLRFDRAAWSNAFLGQIQKLYPQELERWTVLHRRVFGADPIPVEEIEGPSTHIASDMWTTVDTLGYGAYAHAIYRFMTHKQTRSPLTISIQAPWGGGKTSLMRMIQRKLDPAAFVEVKSEGKQLRGELTIGDALQEIDKWITSKTQEALPSIETGKNSEMLTVWFNAWKYENVNQVWAGLVDAVMQQIAARLPLIEREKFWLQLNLKRVDADKLRHRIHERIFRYFWRGVRYWLTAIGGAVLTSILLALAVWLSTSDALLSRWTGISFSVVASGLAAIWKFRNAKSEVEKEPAAVSLSEYLDIPNYSAEIGFIHHVEADLRRVLASVPTQYRPIVIFVDDLDRCSPAKVAQVVEAVNLFLAGDFPNCMFIMGMDTEMVAAALQAAHKEMIACLPSDAGIPVGWRFMDKFVQLPFLIPPTEKGNLERYTSSLFSTDMSHTPDPQVDSLAQEAATRLTTHAAINAETERLRTEHKLSDVQVTRMKDQLEARVVQRQLDEGIEKFNDQNPELQKVISAASLYFRGNPRELKRFINAFRFQYFLWWAQRAQGLSVPTLDQLRRWTVLSMKWPEVVRWLRRSGGSEWRASAEAGAKANGEAALPTRLKLLEEISDAAADLPDWQARALRDLRLKPETTAWLNDDDLLQFFYEECSNYPAGQRLSDGLGKGLW